MENEKTEIETELLKKTTTDADTEVYDTTIHHTYTVYSTLTLHVHGYNIVILCVCVDCIIKENEERVGE